MRLAWAPQVRAECGASNGNTARNHAGGPIRARQVPADDTAHRPGHPVPATGGAERRAGSRLTVMVGSAGAGKSVLLSNWAAARSPGVTSWLSCDSGDANPVRFWTGFIEASRMMAPEFGADATDLLAMDNVMSADVTASQAAELRILKLLPTSTYLQIAATLCISRNTVKSELRSIYQKLGASSRAEAIERPSSCACSEP